MSGKRVDKGSVAAFIIMLCLAVAYVVFLEQAMAFIRNALEFGYFKATLVTGVLIIILTHAIRTGSRGESKFYLVKSGLLPLDVFLTASTYLAVLSTGCTLLEGAYIQQFYGDIKYFNHFNQLDIYVLLGVSSLLIWYVLVHTYDISLELFFTQVKIVNSEIS